METMLEHDQVGQGGYGDRLLVTDGEESAVRHPTVKLAAPDFGDRVVADRRFAEEYGGGARLAADLAFVVGDLSKAALPLRITFLHPEDAPTIAYLHRHGTAVLVRRYRPGDLVHGCVRVPHTVITGRSTTVATGERR